MNIRDIEKRFNLNRVCGVPITDKFRLIEYIKLVGKVCDLYGKGGIEAVKASELYKKDKTLHLLLSLLDARIPYEKIVELIEFYSMNFEDSDVYYSYMMVLGLGVVLISQGKDSHSIISYLISLLGDEFLKRNYSIIIEEREVLDLSSDNVIHVKYKDFDYTYRKLKYDLLAMLSMKQTDGHTAVRKIVYEKYGNKDLALYFALLDIKDGEIADELYLKLIQNSSKMDRFLLCASRYIIRSEQLILMHYMLNAVIGKLSNFDKPVQEVLDEVAMRRAEIEKLV